jgi:hypothetical protein
MPRLSEALQLPRLVDGRSDDRTWPVNEIILEAHVAHGDDDRVIARKYGVSTDAVRRRRDDFEM